MGFDNAAVEGGILLILVLLPGYVCASAAADKRHKRATQMEVFISLPHSCGTSKEARCYTHCPQRGSCQMTQSTWMATVSGEVCTHCPTDMLAHSTSTARVKRDRFLTSSFADVEKRRFRAPNLVEPEFTSGFTQHVVRKMCSGGVKGAGPHSAAIYIYNRRGEYQIRIKNCQVRIIRLIGKRKAKNLFV